ncbi:MAG: DUF3568 family protein [Planctomycetaceae bacterium]|nr:MAG: DUF3568 family protein [Planctomycetaceae bacterium]
MKTVNSILILVISILLISGCDTGFIVGDKVVSVRSGKLIYTDGILTTDYPFPFDKVWEACEKTVVDMKTYDTEKDKKIATGTIDTNLSDEKIHISVKYAAKNLTTVAVRVGLAGNNLAAQLIHEKIKNNLLKK